MTALTHNPIHTVLLVGCGKMGSALLERWLDQKLASHFIVIDPTPLPEALAKDPRIVHEKDVPGQFQKEPDVALIAVKPQILNSVVEKIARHNFKKTLFLSIAAGKPLKIFEQILGAKQSVIRSMPNTPASIGRGVIAAVANASVTREHKEMALRLLGCAGSLIWMGDEDLMDAVTALSGSGPAYVFLLIEAMAKAGEKLGLSPDQAMILARQTVIGSAALAEASPDIPAAQLRQNVTSPGGTTEAALQVLMKDESLQRLFDQALLAARDRGKALSS
ncbi:MAG: pyrroline-5-carboxylate reductase [Alphaproteobacteria bacterium]|nr:pyrroline-5-carboxylate reductase [Alphaproteobacteria bacterium]QQS56150.1 MAG: pyrroline-5-carboxylate reductase [Alphaproteobacteria bacterium]